MTLKKRSSSRLLTLFIIVAFCVNSLLPFFATYTLPTDLQTRTTPLLSIAGKILLCTESGFQWVSLKSLQQSQHHSQHQHTEHHSQQTNSPYKCAICYLVAHGIKDFTFKNSASLYHAFPAIALSFSVEITHSPHDNPSFLLGPLDRAPPLYS